MIDFLLSTGIRVGELVRLNIDDIDFSVLTPMKRIQSIDEFELGKQGIFMRKGIPGR